MSPYDISLIKLDKGYGAMQKKGIKDAYPKKVCHTLRHVQNKRCIPKEGMSHAHKACQKKERKREEEKIAPIHRKMKKRNKRVMIHTKEFINHPPKIYFHTLAHLDQGL